MGAYWRPLGTSWGAPREPRSDSIRAPGGNRVSESRRTHKMTARQEYWFGMSVILQACKSFINYLANLLSGKPVNLRINYLANLCFDVSVI